MKRILASLLTAALLCLSVSANDIISADHNMVDGLAAAAANEISQGYDKVGDTFTHGWRQDVYRTGGLFSGADGMTEIWGDHSISASSQNATAYVSIKNINKNQMDSCSDSGTLNSNRWFSVGASISARYATSVNHSGSLTVN